jgi:predicted RNA-binding Zn ribbon-like protein
MTMTTTEEPRPVAPPAIAVVRDFVNTTDHETGTDELLTRADLVRYLVREGLVDGMPRASADDLALALRLRAGLRSALEAHHDGGTRPGPELAAALEELPVALDWWTDRPVLRPDAAGVRGALARIGIAVHEAASEGLWWRLKICSHDECEWAYYDHSKNRSRSWCEYGCGNKVKTRAYRARLRERSS